MPFYSGTMGGGRAGDTSVPQGSMFPRRIPLLKSHYEEAKLC